MSQDSFLFIPDISGFTEFVNQTEISHSRHVIAELLEVIIQADGLGMTVAEIEGDAVLFFLPGTVPDPAAIFQQARATFEAFHTHLKRYERDRICPCGACQTASSLTLKMVAHRGPVETIEVRGFEKPFGPDVILAHRLLKNDVDDREYLLLTQGVVRDGEEEPEWAPLVQGESQYDSLGPVTYTHAPLGPLRSGIPDPPGPEPLPRSNRPISMEVVLPLPIDEAYQLVSDFGQRLRWSQGVDDLRYDPDRVNRAGTRHQCVIDGNAIEFETVSGDFGSERLVYGERLLDETPVLDPTVYYILEPHSGGTRVSLEVHYRPKPFPRSLMAGLFRWMFSRTLRKSLSALVEVASG